MEHLRSKIQYITFPKNASPKLNLFHPVACTCCQIDKKVQPAIQMPGIHQPQAYTQKPLHTLSLKLQPFDGTGCKQHKQAEAVPPEKITVCRAAAALHQTKRFPKAQYRHCRDEKIAFLPPYLFQCSQHRHPAEQYGAYYSQLGDICVQGKGVPGPKFNAVSRSCPKQNGILPQPIRKPKFSLRERV